MLKEVVHTGKVVEHANSMPLIGAHIVLNGNSSVGTTTDFNGNFRLIGLEGQQYRIGHLGFHETEVTLKKEMPDRTYRLLPGAIELDEFVGTPKKKNNYALGLFMFGALIFIGNRIFN